MSKVNKPNVDIACAQMKNADGSQSPDHISICLNMIVKNESSIITRLLDSVISIIDYVCVCDTGSTDNTVEIIETWMKTNNKPGIVVKEPFKNFGYNRTFSIRAAQKYLKEYHNTEHTVYLLFLDADMKLVIGPSFSKNLLKESNYSVAQKSPELTTISDLSRQQPL